jgi:hypothetical protein
MKFRPAEGELFHTDEETDRRNEANSRLSQFCETLKIMNKIFLGDIRIFRRFYALRVSSITASRLFLKPD